MRREDREAARAAAKAHQGPRARLHVLRIQVPNASGWRLEVNWEAPGLPLVALLCSGLPETAWRVYDADQGGERVPLAEWRRRCADRSAADGKPVSVHAVRLVGLLRATPDAGPERLVHVTLGLMVPTNPRARDGFRPGGHAVSDGVEGWAQLWHKKSGRLRVPPTVPLWDPTKGHDSDEQRDTGQ